MFVRTERLLLRPQWPEDRAVLAALLADPLLERDEAAAIAGEGLVILARTAGAPRVIGAVRLRRNGSRGEVALWIGKAYWGLGFASEVLAAAREMAFGSLRIDRIDARLQPRHAGAIQALLRTGFLPTRDLGGWRGYRLDRDVPGALALAA